MIGKRLKELRKEKGLTLEELAERIGTSKQTIHRYENGIITNIPHEKIEALATALDVTPAHLMGWGGVMSFDGISRIERRRLPLVGDVSCGEPIWVDGEEHDVFVIADAELDADFCLRARGDSMTGARIYDGDIVFIKQMPMVNNGEIAAVIIDNEATLKRVYFYPEKGKLVLQAENPKYEPMVFIGEELNEIRILGKAVAFQSDII